MKAELLKTRYDSGEYEEIYINVSIENVSVKFLDKFYSEYCAVFGGGSGSYCDISTGNNNVFVISYGQGYIFDVNSRNVICKSQTDFLNMVIFEEKNQFFITHDNTHLYVYNDAHLLWESKRISLDGINILRFNHELITGTVFVYGDNVTFELDLHNFELTSEVELDLD